MTGRLRELILSPACESYLNPVSGFSHERGNAVYCIRPHSKGTFSVGECGTFLSTLTTVAWREGLESVSLEFVVVVAWHDDFVNTCVAKA